MRFIDVERGAVRLNPRQEMQGNAGFIRCETVDYIARVFCKYGPNNWHCSSSVDFCEEYGMTQGMAHWMLDEALKLYEIISEETV